MSEQDNKECGAVRCLLSEYVDGTLSARQTWGIERHLSYCQRCSLEAQQLRLTVGLLHAAPRLDTQHDFMQRLHARLDTLPEPARVSPWQQTRIWGSGLLSTLANPGRAVALGAAAAACGAALVFAGPALFRTPVRADGSLSSPAVQQAVERHLATSATDPLGDVAAEKLMSQDGSTDSGASD